jgi:hypothetical protein
MSEAIERIVGAYVKLRNRKGTLDLSSSIKQLEDEIAVIDAGLARLNTSAAA